MITYILKTILCSSILILIYYLFLEREKMYRFNRFYLLFSILFSFIIPLATIRISSSINLVSETINLANNSFSNSVIRQTQPSISGYNTLSFIPLLLYIIVTAFLICRFFINIFIILFKIKNNNSVPFFEARLVLTGDKRGPYSFFKYIFIHREDHEKGIIEKEIIGHELTHVKQKHSLDILFFELLLCFVWFNPLLLLYRKAIQLNHEFLADEFVINSLSDTQTYQLLLLDKARQTDNLVFSSSFNYLLIKRRIIMMTKNASKKIAIFKQIALIPVIAAIGFLFMKKIVAQDVVQIQMDRQQQVDFTQKGVSPELMSEYKNIIDKYSQELMTDSANMFNKPRPSPDKWGNEFKQKLSSSDKERLETIFFQMSKEQQGRQKVAFMPMHPLSRIVPTKEQLESFKDSKMYGVWIDGMRVSNEILNNYKNTDFGYIFQSKLMKNATNYGKHVYQVDLMTNDYFQSHKDPSNAGKNIPMILIFKNQGFGIMNNF
jgi:bla regulator protein blaR1